MYNIEAKIYPERKGFIPHERYEEYLEFMKMAKDRGVNAKARHEIGDIFLYEFLIEVGFYELAFKWRELSN